jgi:hypothetical protein
MRIGTLMPAEGLSKDQDCAWRVSVLRALSAAYRFSLSSRVRGGRDEGEFVTVIDEDGMAPTIFRGVFNG